MTIVSSTSHHRRFTLGLLGCVLMVAGGARAETRYVEGEVIVTFKAKATLANANAALKRKTMAFTKRFTGLSAKRKKQTGLVHHATKTTAQLIADLQNDPDVETVEPNYLRWVRTVPNDARFAEMWALRNTGQTVNGTSGTAAADTKFVAAREMARSPQGEIVVGVIDTGVDYVHPELAPNLWTNTGEIPGNNLDDDANGYVDDRQGYDFASNHWDPSDSGDHGTHVAGIIAALGDNGLGVIGVNDRARLLPLKVSANGESIDSAATILAMQYATALKARGVNIVALNASYGGGGFSAAESAAIQAAGDAGIIVCAAAGNDSSNNDTVSTYPASYHLPNMIVVAATDQNDDLASFSNHGATTVDIAAPGSDILSTEPSSIAITVGGNTYASAPFSFAGATTGLTGNIIDCGIGNPSDFPSTVNGNIALIQRGTLTFTTKVTNAMAAGAIAAIIYNNTSGSINGTLQFAANWIPTRAISQADGLAIKATLPSAGSFVITAGYQYLDGTSMATPHVAGAVALAAMNHPGDTLVQRRQRMLAGVDVKSSLQGKVATGGRLNLLRVVDANSNGFADWRETLPAVTTSTLPTAVHGEDYSQTLAVIGGIAPYSWSLIGGALPSGFSLSNTGVITGTSSISGTFTFTVEVSDHLGALGSRSLTLNTAAFGPLDHFTWSYMPAKVYAGTAFAVHLTARDAGERAITDFNGTIFVTSPAAVSPSSIALTDGAFVGYLTVAQAAASTTITASQAAITSPSSAIMVQSGASIANDGVPDAWKALHGVSDASLDSDGDGATNLDEFNAGTDPSSALSVLKVTSTSTDAATQFRLAFPAVAGKLYRLSQSADLNVWSPLVPNILATQDGEQSRSLTLAGQPRFFIRLEVQP